MPDIWGVVYSYLCWLLRPISKWFLRKTTRLCELQRILSDNSFVGAKQGLAIENSLNLSRDPQIKALTSQMAVFCAEGRLKAENGNRLVEFSAQSIAKIKRIKVKIHRTFIPNLTICLAQIYGYKQLCYEVEQIRKILYNSDNQVHEEKLLKLWSHLMEDKALDNRISKMWGEIGFQGDDPKTDFRGMGILGLENLLYFAGEHPLVARQVLSHSHHPKYGYSFAIVGINITSMAFDLLLKGDLKCHMWNSIDGRPSVNHFHQVYCYLFFEFDRFWMSEKPANVMEFNRIRDVFLSHLGGQLSNTSVKLKLTYFVEKV